MSNLSYAPGLGNTPFGNTNTNPQASQYAGISNYSPAEQILIAKEVQKVIIDTAPEQYNSLKLVFAKTPEDRNLDEFSYLEKTFGRTPIEADVAGAGANMGAKVAGAGGATTPQTQTITLTPSSMNYVTKDLIIVYPNNAKAVIRDINVANKSITVESQSGDGLPAVNAGDIFAFQSTIMADAMTDFSNYERMEVIERYNFIQFFLRAQRWGRIELQKHINAGTTDYLVKDKREKIRQLRIDMFNSYWNGQRGEFRVANGYQAKAMGGVVPTMISAGSMSGNPTLNGLKSTFERLAFATNFKKEGSVRFIYGCDEILYDLSKVWKEPGIRYQPNDYIADLNLTEYRLGSMRFVPVSCELFRERSCFPADWARKLIVLDQESINPIKLKGIGQFSSGETNDRKDGMGGSREAFKDSWFEGQLSMEYTNPLGGYIIDVQ